MNQVAQGEVSPFPKMPSAVVDDFGPFRDTALCLTFTRQDAGAYQNSESIARKRIRNRFSRTQPRDNRFQPGPQPKRLQGTSSWVTHPCNRSPQIEILH